MNNTDIRMIAIIDKDNHVHYVTINPEDRVEATMDLHNFNDELKITQLNIHADLMPTSHNLYMSSTIGEFIDSIIEKEN